MYNKQLIQSSLTIKTSAAILATATWPECIDFIHVAKSRGRCCRQSCWLNLNRHAGLCHKEPL